jgi:DNA-binding NtrC family response regulator
VSSTPFPPAPVLLVDDEEMALAAADFALRTQGITNLARCRDAREVPGLLGSGEYSAVLLDLSMPHLSGRELLPAIVQEHPELPVIVLTGANDVETAVRCMKDGAFDYLLKPVDEARLESALRRAIEIGAMRRENSALKRYLLTDALEHPEAFAGIVTAAKSMRAIFQYAEAVAPTPLPILVTGETGVGKELIARAIHALSGRQGPFLPVNVAGLDDALFSDALFGHKRGGFTGADRDRPGLVEQAASGTLFLDEIGDLSPASQVKLLRLLQDSTYLPIGSDVMKRADIRVLVATNRDLRALQASGAFRKDLFYRLQAHHLHLPPLRERREDLPLLVAHFLSKAARELGRQAPTPPRELVPLLQLYAFPGNVRELEGLVYDALSRHRSGVLSLQSFRERTGLAEGSASGPAGAQPGSAGGQAGEPGAAGGGLVFPDPLPTLKRTEEALIREALRRAGGNQTQAAGLLGLSRRALNNRLARDAAGTGREAQAGGQAGSER